FLCCRLTRTSRDADDRHPPEPTNRPGQFLQRFNCRTDPDNRATRGLTPCCGIFLHHHTCRFLIDGLIDELMAVETRALYCKEQFAGVERPGVDGISPDFRVAG